MTAIMTAIAKHFQYNKKPLKSINGLIFGLNSTYKKFKGISALAKIPFFVVAGVGLEPTTFGL